MEHINSIFEIRFVQPIHFFKAGHFDYSPLNDTTIYSKSYPLRFIPDTNFNPASLIGNNIEKYLFNKIESIRYFDYQTSSLDAICAPLNISVGSLYELNHLLDTTIFNFLKTERACNFCQELLALKEVIKDAREENTLVRDLTKKWPTRSQIGITLNMCLPLITNKTDNKNQENYSVESLGYEITRDNNKEKTGFSFSKKIFLDHIPVKENVYELDGDLIIIKKLTYLEKDQEWIASVYPLDSLSLEPIYLKKFSTSAEMNCFIAEYLETGWCCENLKKESISVIKNILNKRS